MRRSGPRGRSTARATRRAVLRTGGSVLAGTAALSASASAGATPDFGGWFDDTGNYTGIVDKRGTSSVTVEVGAEGNGGTYAFAPAAVRVDPGTTVRFEWVSNTHNVLVESQPGGADWNGVSAIKNEGFAHEHTFETEGVYKYYCEPHLPMGMKGAVVVGDVAVTSGGDGGRSGEGGSALPGSATDQVILTVLLGGGFLSAVIALLPEIVAAPGVLLRRLSGAGYRLKRHNSFRNRPVGSALVGPIAVLVVLAAIGALAVGLWSISGGGPAFLAAVAAVVVVALLYAKSSAGVGLVPRSGGGAGPRVTATWSGTRGPGMPRPGTALRRSIRVVRGWIGVGLLLATLAAGAVGLREVAGGPLPFLAGLAVVAAVVAWYAVASGR